MPRIAFFALLAFVAPCLGHAKTLTVVTTTDFHGALDPADGMGGAEALASALKVMRDKEGAENVLWVDAGDLFQGTLISNEQEGEAVVRVFNHLGLAAAALGNHEFDYGPTGPASTPRSRTDDPRGALKARVKQMRFPLLAVNVRTDDGKLPQWLKRSTVVTKAGVKVGIIGASALETPSTTNVLNLKGLRFEDPTAPVIAEARRLRKQGVAIVLLVIHDSTRCPDGEKSALRTQWSGCEEGSFMKMIRALPQGLVDGVIAGHTHTLLAKTYDGMPVIQSGSRGKWLGVLRLSTEPSATRPAPILEIQDLKASAENEVTPILKADRDSVSVRLQAPAGVKTAGPFRGNKLAQSALGNLVADASLKGCNQCADLALVNNGTLRSDLPTGNLTYERIFNVVPFDNTLMVLTLTGDDLLKLMEIGAGRQIETYSWSSNVQGKMDGCQGTSLTINNKPVVRSAPYTVAVTDFLAFGGSGFSDLRISDAQRRMAPAKVPPGFRDVIHRGLQGLPQPLEPDSYTMPRIVIFGACAPGTQNSH